MANVQYNCQLSLYFGKCKLSYKSSSSQLIIDFHDNDLQTFDTHFINAPPLWKP